MSGVGFSEFLILCLIGLIVLGPKRLPQVASQIGNWVGQARRMTRVMKRQLEDELNFDEDLNIKPRANPIPNDDDTYSPLHSQPTGVTASVDIAPGETEEMPDEPVEEAAEPDAEKSDDSERKKDA